MSRTVPIFFLTSRRSAPSPSPFLYCRDTTLSPIFRTHLVRHLSFHKHHASPLGRTNRSWHFGEMAACQFLFGQSYPHQPIYLYLHSHHHHHRRQHAPHFPQPPPPHHQFILYHWAAERRAWSGQRRRKSGKCIAPPKLRQQSCGPKARREHSSATK